MSINDKQYDECSQCNKPILEAGGPVILGNKAFHRACTKGNAPTASAIFESIMNESVYFPDWMCGNAGEWAEFLIEWKKLGYQYGADALENVFLGWTLAKKHSIKVS